MLCKISVSICRSNTYLMIGLCLGLSLSLLFSPEDIIDEYHQQQVEKQQKNKFDSSWYSTGLSAPGQIDEYIPRINIEGKPRHAQKFPKTIVRPRYYSTELGIRDKIFVGILTSKEHLYSRGVAFNKTVAHLVDKVRYFITIPEGGKPNVSLPGIVGFTDTRIILKPFHVIKYITDNYLEEYDYYFISKDSTYVNARGLLDLINKISISQDVHLGTLLEDSKEFCSLDGGILLGNALLRKMKTNLDWCVKNTFSIFDDVNFGRCVYHSTKIPCFNSINNVKFNSIKVPPSSLNPEDNDVYINHLKELNNSHDFVSLYPVNNHKNIYKIHAHFALNKMKKIDQDVETLGGKIFDSFKYSTNLTIKDSTWPIGNQKENKALGRFDILRWNYFNESHILMSTDFENIRDLSGSLKIEIDQAIEAGKIKIQEKYQDNLKFEKLKNGWRKFDASRGIDYILDINFIDSTSGKKNTKRIQVCKLFGKAEILSVPYVTENTRINLILPVNNRKIDETIKFIEHYSNVCMKNKDKTSLMLVLLYDPDSPSKGTEDNFYNVKRLALNLTDKYKRDQSKITWLSIRLPRNLSVFDPDFTPQIVIADLVMKKFSPESLILFIETKVLLEPEYLNRVRMNTISQWQVFSPIPFVEFQPNIAYSDDTKNSGIDINRNNGRYDNLNYESISFYVKDYQNVRKISQYDIPFIRTDKDILKSFNFIKKNIDSILQLFIVYSNLHSFRAVEPALKILYSELNCQQDSNFYKQEICEERKLQRLGQRRQLANLILDYQETITENSSM